MQPEQRKDNTEIVSRPEPKRINVRPGLQKLIQGEQEPPVENAPKTPAPTPAKKKRERKDVTEGPSFKATFRLTSEQNRRLEEIWMRRRLEDPSGKLTKQAIFDEALEMVFKKYKGMLLS